LSILPDLSGRELIALLERLGYRVDRRKGSHIILRHPSPPHRRIVVPDHKEIARGTLRAIIRQVGLSVDDFLRLL
jgi:predicted RNA binding protein YcfA (HicA-like mRNA interferase family)